MQHFDFVQVPFQALPGHFIHVDCMAQGLVVVASAKATISFTNATFIEVRYKPNHSLMYHCGC